MKRKGISKERLKKIKDLDLLTYYTNYEPDELIPNGRGDYKTKTYSSLHLSNGLWSYWNKKIGGRTALDFFVKVKRYDFLEAAHYLDELIEKNPPEKIFQHRNNKTHKLYLPRRNTNNEIIKKYLAEERKIDKQIIQYCIDKGLIYESEKEHAVIFVGYDSHNFPRHAAFRSTDDTTKKDVYGSNKMYSFSIRNPSSRKVHVFESAIDLLSYMTLLKNSGRDYLRDNYLSLSGASIIGISVAGSSIPAALDRFIKEEFIDTVYLHLDNDKAGKETSEKIIFHLKDKLKVYNQPPSMGKDFNELLQIKMCKRKKSFEIGN